MGKIEETNSKDNLEIDKDKVLQAQIQTESSASSDKAEDSVEKKSEDESTRCDVAKSNSQEKESTPSEDISNGASDEASNKNVNGEDQDKSEAGKDDKSKNNTLRRRKSKNNTLKKKRRKSKIA